MCDAKSIPVPLRNSTVTKSGQIGHTGRLRLVKGTDSIRARGIQSRLRFAHRVTQYARQKSIRRAFGLVTISTKITGVTAVNTGDDVSLTLPRFSTFRPYPVFISFPILALSAEFVLFTILALGPQTGCSSSLLSRSGCEENAILGCGLA
jgi:hypothetical protein